MGSVSVYTPVLYHQYVVRMLHTGYALGNDDFGGSRYCRPKGFPDSGICRRIHRAGGIVQYQDPGVL